MEAGSVVPVLHLDLLSFAVDVVVGAPQVAAGLLLLGLGDVGDVVAVEVAPDAVLAVVLSGQVDVLQHVVGLVAEEPHGGYVGLDFGGVVEGLVLALDDLLGVRGFQVYEADLGGEEALEGAEERTL